MRYWRRARFAGGALCAVLAPAALVACRSAPAHEPHPSPSASPSADLSPSAVAANASPTPGAAPSGARTVHTPAHVVVVVFENKSYRQVVGLSQAPWINGLVASSAVLTDAHAITHPSQPNYLALFSGSTQAVTDDHCPVDLANVPNLAQQLRAAGHSFVGYSEDLPKAGYLGCSHAGYAAKHNPWVDFSNVPDTANQPFTAFPTDYATLPTVSFVIPNLCHDMHDCSIAAGDTWARTHLDGYVKWARQHDSLLILTFDEDDNAPSNHILTLFAGAGIKPGAYRQTVNHYNVLHTIESWYGLAPLQRAAEAPAITAIWTGPS
ncbi:MAG: phosphatidylinositol-3-phosphatase [Micromonosporaceae bacterium]